MLKPNRGRFFYSFGSSFWSFLGLLLVRCFIQFRVGSGPFNRNQFLCGVPLTANCEPTHT